MPEDKRTKQEGTNIIKRTYQLKHAAEPHKPKLPFWPSFIRCVLIAATTALVFNAMFGIAVVSGTSMEPALLEGDVLLFWKLSSSYKRGDIALVSRNGSTDYVKRICAVPGDMLECGGNPELFLINGEVPDEPYIYEKTYGKAEISYPLTLGINEYFVMGDHRGDSYDSRNYGAVSVKQIDGRALIIFRGGI
ncbi:signal peptidase I [Lacrimispora indolis]|uniref:signal peptidase I n=1 Tax=Lacrimispora indolis TaxID=69825 RepID=UPI00045E6170|nr:signal peptidase I [Lacrimispora indolis]